MAIRRVLKVVESNTERTTHLYNKFEYQRQVSSSSKSE